MNTRAMVGSFRELGFLIENDHALGSFCFTDPVESGLGCKSMASTSVSELHELLDRVVFCFTGDENPGVHDVFLEHPSRCGHGR